MKHRRIVVAAVMAGTLLVAGFGWQRHGASMLPLMTGQVVAEVENGRSADAAGAASVPGALGADRPAALPAPLVALPPAPAQPVLSARQVADLQLTRQLAGEHRFLDDGRAFQVLGSKETVDASGSSATMVVTVDELSGQVRYHLPGLQFSVKPGVDAEAFIVEHPRLRRLFVNPIYAQVAVDAAQLAEQFMRLRQDPRVDRLRLMTREPVRTPK